MVAGAAELLMFWVLNPWWDLCMFTFFALANALWQNCGWMCQGRFAFDDGDGDGVGIDQTDDGTRCKHKSKSCGCAASPPPAPGY